LKKGPRAGKPLSQCEECMKVSKGRNPRTSGYIAISEVWWAFTELQRRLGKAETLRRMGISQNFWYRVENHIYVNMRRTTARKAISLLAEVRKDGEVRHRASIHRGATRRGESERIPVKQKDLYVPTGDKQVEVRRNYRKTHHDQELEAERRRTARRREASG